MTRATFPPAPRGSNMVYTEPCWGGGALAVEADTQQDTTRGAAARPPRRRAAQGAAGDGERLPVLPLRTAVVLPGERAVLPVGRPRSVAAVRAAQAGDGRLLLCPQRDPECEQPRPSDLHPIATVARLLDSQAEGDGLRVAVEGLDRSGWSGARRGRGAGPLRATARGRQGDHATEGAAEAGLWLWQQVRPLLGPRTRGGPEEAGLPPADRPGAFADAVAARLLQGRDERLQLLGLAEVGPRLEALHRLLLPRLPRPAADPEVARRTLRNMQQAQRRHYLHEQLRVIRRELGEEEDGVAERWRARLAAADLPPPALEAGLREAARLERMAPGSAEAVIAGGYLEWLSELPWSRRSEERRDLDAARRLLDQEHHGLEAVKERILEHLAVYILRARADAPGPAAGNALCLAGPPGTGKTSLARSMAEALGRPFVRVPLGGVRDEAEIRGHRRTYVGALPGRILTGMRRAGARNPVMLLDEIDKLGGDAQGDPGAALLEVLDPEQQAVFSDHYLEVAFDLGEVMFVATANDLAALPAPLYDRLEPVQLPAYTEDEKAAIALGHLLPRQMARHALPPGALTVGEEAVRALIREHTREAGVRSLERAIAALCRKAARRVLEEPGDRLRVTARDLGRWFGPLDGE